MGDRGDEVVLHLFGGAQFPGHVVDGVAQIADLVVFGLVNAHGEVALSDLPGALAQLPHRHQDGPDEVHARQGEQQHDEGPGGYQHENDEGDLPVGHLHGHQVPHRADEGAAVVPNHPGDGHGFFPGI